MEYELVHWGIKGMKWGVRRYQNEDGSLTEAGRRREARLDARRRKRELRFEVDPSHRARDTKLAKDLMDEENNFRESAKKLRDNSDLTVGLKNTQSVANDAANLANRLKQATDKSIKNTPKTRLNLEGISDQELRNRINRELLERQYNDVFNPPTVNRGKEMASKFLETSADVLMIAGSAVGLALSVKALAGK